LAGRAPIFRAAASKQKALPDMKLRIRVPSIHRGIQNTEPQTLAQQFAFLPGIFWPKQTFIGASTERLPLESATLL
jgi:hypothetical protein